MKSIGIKNLYFSAVALVIFTMMLLIYVAFFTYHALDSNKENAMAVIEKKGDAIIDILSVSLLNLSADKTPAKNVLALEHLAKKLKTTKTIERLCIIGESGSILFQSDPLCKSDSGTLMMEIVQKEKTTRYRTLQDGSAVFEISRKLPPGFSAIISEPGAYIIIGMEMDSFESARKADIHHAAIMIGILVSVSFATFLFVIIIRKYYHVNLELIESGDYIASVVENMANGVISTDANGIIASCNRPAELMLEINRPDKPAGIPLGDLIDLEETGIIDTFTKGIPVRNRELRYTKGKEKTLLLNATPLMETPGTIKGAVIILNNLTELKQLEEKVRRSENLAMIGKIAAIVAHEIRNPLSSIRGFANFFSKAFADDAKNLEYSRIIVSEVDRINRVITDLLHYSKNETPDLKKADLHNLVSQAILLTETEQKDTDATVTNTIPASFPEVPVDTDKIKQVLLNLILNALQVGSQGIEIEIGAETADNNDYRIWVTDTGPGLEPEEKETVFEPFYTRREGGTGLGLSIVKRIIENHNGSIRYESPVQTDGTGTKFILTLPFDINHSGSHEK